MVMVLDKGDATDGPNAFKSMIFTAYVALVSTATVYEVVDGGTVYTVEDSCVGDAHSELSTTEHMRRINTSCTPMTEAWMPCSRVTKVMRCITMKHRSVAMTAQPMVN